MTSRTKWQSTPICLVLSWKTEFWDMCRAAWLSQYSNTGIMCITLRLDKILFNHFNSQLVIAIKRYSAPTDDLDIVCSFFIFQDIGESPRNIIQPVSDLWVNGQPAQSSSHHPCRRRSHLLLNKIPYPGFYFR